MVNILNYFSRCSNNPGMVGVPVVPMQNLASPQSKSKVRYYVREYGGESDSGVQRKHKRRLEYCVLCI